MTFEVPRLVRALFGSLYVKGHLLVASGISWLDWELVGRKAEALKCISGGCRRFA